MSHIGDARTYLAPLRPENGACSGYAHQAVWRSKHCPQALRPRQRSQARKPARWRAGFPDWEAPTRALLEVRRCSSRAAHALRPKCLGREQSLHRREVIQSLWRARAQGLHVRLHVQAACLVEELCSRMAHRSRFYLSPLAAPRSGELIGFAGMNDRTRSREGPSGAEVGPPVAAALPANAS
jgi:hypothetical protein